MTYKITWLNNGFVQVKELVYCKKKESFFTMNSPLYKAVEDGSFCLDLGEFGKHPFKLEQI